MIGGVGGVDDVDDGVDSPCMVGDDRCFVTVNCLNCLILSSLLPDMEMSDTDVIIR